LLIGLIGESNKAIASRHARKRIGHDLGGFAGWESALEKRHQDILVDFRTEITHEDAEFWASIISSIGKATTTSPIELEWSVRVWHLLAVEAQSFGSSLRRSKINEAISSIAAI